MMNNTAYLSIGSNLGDKKANLQAAISALKNNPKISDVSVSSIYKTEPVGDVVQDDFYNQAIRLQTTDSPIELLELIHQIETDLKRTRDIHWGPRTIDLDILFFNDSTINESDLIIPHPEIANRRFVLIPLLEIVEEQDLREKINLMLQQTQDINEVKKI